MDSFKNITTALTLTNPATISEGPSLLTSESPSNKRKTRWLQNESYSATESNSNSSLFKNDDESDEDLSTPKMLRVTNEAMQSSSEGYQQFVELDTLSQQVKGLQLTSFIEGKPIKRTAKGTLTALCDTDSPCEGQTLLRR